MLIVQADRQSNSVVSFHSDCNIIKAKGFVFDTIDGLAQHEGLAQHDLGDSKSRTTHHPLYQATSCSNPYDGWDAVDAIWRSLVADLIPPGHRSSHEALSLFLRQCRSSKAISSIEKRYDFTHWYNANKYLIVAGRTIAEWSNDSSIP